jgi:hypothetical protein
MEETKAPVLWTVQCEGVDESGWQLQHRGMIRNTMATQRNKWQQKRMKTDDGMTLNVNRGLIDGTQGANKEVKKSSLGSLK